ncbi:cysteine hydrolase [Nocardia sp. CDC159]|uniref:Cysteine hydrolase n=1 Tax=Nocardia pulmonis TaxID=2951408 RepID=A0A9X2EB92_9NOCA|nr:MULTISPECIES: cysteine hydrolase [Nocardia]MCM6777557.1 cysteine hydrolase [Nocardia pulmonis]MCM6790336.1 cysteine hydrolase [Nocardia sp. CDC159]
MLLDRDRTAVLALHWQVNVVKPEGFFGPMLAEPVAASGVIERAVDFHAAALAVGIPVLFTRFTVPVGEGDLVRNTGFMRSVAAAQTEFRPDAPGAQIIPEMRQQVADGAVFDNQKLSGLAASALPRWLTTRGINTLLITGVATNLTVEQTARHGTDLGFIVHPVSDCVTAVTLEAHISSLANLELATAGCLSAEQALPGAGAVRP